MSKYIDTEDLHKVVLKRKTEYGKFADLIDNIVEEMVKETPYAEVVEKERYEVLQSENEVLWRQLHQSRAIIGELEKLNGNTRDKIKKAIKRIEDLADENHDKDSCKDFCSGLLVALAILKNDLKE